MFSFLFLFLQVYIFLEIKLTLQLMLKCLQLMSEMFLLVFIFPNKKSYCALDLTLVSSDFPRKEAKFQLPLKNKETNKHL